jgi:YD repeat-containing protein
VTQIANGQSTTTYSYDQNGNLSQKTTDGVTTTYMWDYANRLIALGSGGATTTYGYDAFGSRVFQTTAMSTTIYPFRVDVSLKHFLLEDVGKLMAAEMPSKLLRSYTGTRFVAIEQMGIPALHWELADAQRALAKVASTEKRPAPATKT